MVRDIVPVDLVGKTLQSPGLSLAEYRGIMEKTSRKRFAYRHHCSAVSVAFVCNKQDYFVFSRSTPLSAFGPYVLGRYNIDNYLLSRMKESNGSLVDTTFACGGGKRG